MIRISKAKAAEDLMIDLVIIFFWIRKWLEIKGRIRNISQTPLDIRNRSSCLKIRRICFTVLISGPAFMKPQTTFFYLGQKLIHIHRNRGRLYTLPRCCWDRKANLSPRALLKAD